MVLVVHGRCGWDRSSRRRDQDRAHPRLHARARQGTLSAVRHHCLRHLRERQEWLTRARQKVRVLEDRQVHDVALLSRTHGDKELTGARVTVRHTCGGVVAMVHGSTQPRGRSR